jgi:pimeloyl-ACP methyl ester carboxylesterase
VAKVSSLSPSPEKEPLVPLPTGPGSSAIDAFLDFVASPVGGMFRANRDAVLIEQRGLFYSEKNLVCSEAHEWFGDSILEDIQGEDRVMKTVDAFATCRESLLKKEVDLNAYRYVETADDIILAMDALGYRKSNALGISAGTMLSQQLLKRHSERVRSVLINSVVRIDRPLRSSWPAYSARYLKKLFEACIADETCNEAFPNLGEKLERTIKRLKDAPYRVEIEEPRSGNKRLAIINGDRLAEAIFVMGYSKYGLGLLRRVTGTAG